ncbi:tRNA (guanine-N(1)-)-methyltransferase [Mesomycoplasma conjunctivae]|uniref:tRNA (guanosine(37)-N1)-methyltransferase TrmD n=1 Tax=Mesomycoplasma conjunctivae TaxID=45361 RepID=UPI0010052594|nr:tRNA (guanine-N(1)-)-methyltransferase [Mesomycoplasma conjunctivae]
MKINFVSLFPNYFSNFSQESIIGKAVKNKIVTIETIDIRDYTLDKFKRVDDQVYGGGPGMLMQIEPIERALKNLKGIKIALSPQGIPFNQEMATKLAQYDEISLLCGRYEGFDERVIDHLVDLEISIGDFVLTGGELAAMVVADAVVRLLPGVINQNSLNSESFNSGLLDFPQYTRPREYQGWKVPEVLFSGNHKLIEEWRKEKQIEKTQKNRPDLWDRYKRKDNHAK